MGGIIPDIHVGDSIPDILVLKMRDIDFEYAIWETLFPFDFKYGRRYSLLILNVGGVIPRY